MSCILTQYYESLCYIVGNIKPSVGHKTDYLALKASDTLSY